MEVEAAARRLMLADDTVNGYVTGKVWRHRLEEQIEGSSGRAIVFGRNNGWVTPDPVKTAEFPILTMKCYADPTRGDDGEVLRLDAEDKAFALYRAANRLIHGARGVRWGAIGSNPGLMVVTAARWKEPVLIGEKDRHGQTAGDPLGEVVYVYVEYAMQVIH